MTAVYVSLGVAAFLAWGASGNIGWVVRFFRVPGALLLVWLALMELWLVLRVRSHFEEGEPLRTAWTWISLSALCQFVGTCCSQVLGLKEGINLLARLPGWNAGISDSIRQSGLLFGGSFRYGLLAIGLARMLRAYRKHDALGRLRAADWVILALACAYVVEEFRGVAVALRNGKHPGTWEVAGWPVDPLLVVLLGIAIVLHRSSRRLGPGWRTSCWAAYSIGIFLVLLGDFGMWLTNYGYLGLRSSAVVWFVWLPAGCAFALAPAYRLESITRAVRERRHAF